MILHDSVPFVNMEKELYETMKKTCHEVLNHGLEIIENPLTNFMINAYYPCLTYVCFTLE